MNVQELVVRMMFCMQKGKNPKGQPMTTMAELYVAFENDFDAVAKMTYPSTNTGVVFATCLDAVEKLKCALRATAEAALAAEPEPAPVTQRRTRATVTPAPVTSRRVTTKAVARNGGKKPGVGRTVASNAATAVKRRPGRPRKNT